MTDRLDRLVRDAVHDLADGADVITDRDRRRLALHASEHAHTLRLRRRGAVAGMVALVVALAVGLPYGLRYLGTVTGTTVTLPGGILPIEGVPTHVIDDASQPIELVDGWYVAGNRLVLNPSTRAYNSYHTPTVIPSPNGRWVATQGSDSAFRMYDQDSGTNVRVEARQTNGGVQLVAGWSADSNTLLIPTVLPAGGSLLNGVPHDATVLNLYGINPESGERSARLLWSLPADDLGCDHGCGVTVLPDRRIGLEVIVDTDGDGHGDVVTGVQTFTLDGRRGPLLPIQGSPLGPWPWSPDGRYVLVRADHAPGSTAYPTQLVDATTGRVRESWPELDAWAAQWIDNSHYLTAEPLPTDNPEDDRRIMISLWSIDTGLQERWIPPIEVLSGVIFGNLAIHVG